MPINSSLWQDKWKQIISPDTFTWFLLSNQSLPARMSFFLNDHFYIRKYVHLVSRQVDKWKCSSYYISYSSQDPLLKFFVYHLLFSSTHSRLHLDKDQAPIFMQAHFLNYLCIFIGRTDVEDETPILWPPDAKSWLIWKDPGAGKDWGQEQKGMGESEMVGWHHQLNGHGFG